MHSLVKLGGRDFYMPVLSLKRGASILDGPSAGRTMDGTMQRDIIGTFYNYDIAFDMSLLSQKEYDEFYEIITAPVDSQRIVVPYGQKTLGYDAYISNASDDLRKDSGQDRQWGNLAVSFTAMKPQRV